MRSFQAELFSRFLPSSYAGHVNLALAKHWLFTPKWKYGSCGEFIIFRVQDLCSVHLMKPFVDFRRGMTPRCTLSGCLSSVVCRVHSVRLATARLMPDGWIPANTGRLFVFVGFRQLVIIRHVSFSVAFSFFAWVDRSHTGQVFWPANEVTTLRQIISLK